MLRKYFAPFALCLALSMGGCAGMSTSTGSALSASEAITQAQGASAALAELSKTSPLDDKTKEQIKGYAAWVDFALRAAGIVATVDAGS